MTRFSQQPGTAQGKRHGGRSTEPGSSRAPEHEPPAVD